MRRYIFVFTTTLLAVIVGGGAVVAHFTESWPDTSIKLYGAYHVGTVAYDLTDPTRPEILADQPAGKREILVTAYYPAQPAAGAKPAPFVSGAMATGVKNVTGFTATFVNAAFHSPIFGGAPVVTQPARYPVLLFSPGWGTDPLQYAPTLADLASRGYIVFALWHTYSCDFTPFPDGRIRYATKAGSDPDHYPDEQSQQLTIRQRVGGVWQGDVQFVLQQLIQLNQTDPRLAGHLDLSTIGMFGHSFGGTIALAEASDPRLRAVADLDGGLFIGDPDSAGAPKPMLLLQSDTPVVTDQELAQSGETRQQYETALAHYYAQEQAFTAHSRPGYDLQLAGATHVTFQATTALIAPRIPDQLPPQAVGTIRGQRAIQVYDDYVAAFFDTYLQHTTSPLLAGPSPRYPEMRFFGNQ